MAISITLTDDDARDYLSMRRLDNVESAVNLDDYIKITPGPVTSVSSPAQVAALSGPTPVETAAAAVTFAVLPEIMSAKGTLLDAKFGVSVADLPETGVHFADHGNITPNVPPAPPAPSSAAAVTPTIAPTDGISILLDPDLAFGTNVPTPVPAAPIAAVPTPPGPPPAPPVSVPSLPSSGSWEQAVPPAPPPIVPAVVQRDKDGLPWDNRIHSASKALNQDGTWRTKRGVAPELLRAVTAELNTLMGLPSPKLPLTDAPIAPPAPPAVLWPHAPGYGLVPPDSEAGKAILATQAPPAPTTLPLAPPAPPVPPAPPTAAPVQQPTIAPQPAAAAAPSGAITTLAQLMPLVMAKVQAGTLTKEQVGEACKSVGVVALPLLANRQDLIPTVAAALGL